MFKKLFALALLSALGFSMTSAQAAFDHRDGNRGFNSASRHGDFKQVRHVRHHRHHRFNRGNR